MLGFGARLRISHTSSVGGNSRAIKDDNVLNGSSATDIILPSAKLSRSARNVPERSRSVASCQGPNNKRLISAEISIVLVIGLEPMAGKRLNT
jgi:hypothetical protein